MKPEETLLTGGEALAALPALAGPLLGWYDRHARKLPWREDPTPYRVWVSEIMLQQTRVEAVRGHYARFLQALPDIAALAAAPDDRLMKLWEGLGYYSRARNLKKAARIVLERHGGKLPASYEELRALPGIGDYTAGAVASIAFGIAVPAVDGNVCRVLSRILASAADTGAPAVKAALRAAAASVLPPARPGDFNQALMELGATVCLPGAALLCGSCPVADHCAGRREGTARELPVRAQKKPRRVEERTILLVAAGDRLLLFRRGNGGLLAGMFEPLNLEGFLDAEEAARAVRAIGGEPLRVAALPDARHLFTHVEWRMRGFRVDCAEFPAEGGVWAERGGLYGGIARPSREVALPSAFRAVVAAGLCDGN